MFSSELPSNIKTGTDRERNHKKGEGDKIHERKWSSICIWFKWCSINSRDTSTVCYMFALFFQLWWIPEQNGGSHIGTYLHIKVMILHEIVCWAIMPGTEETEDQNCRMKKSFLFESTVRIVVNLSLVTEQRNMVTHKLGMCETRLSYTTTITFFFKFS